MEQISIRHIEQISKFKNPHVQTNLTALPSDTTKIPDGTVLHVKKPAGATTDQVYLVVAGKTIRLYGS